mgnify:CR=1 FL=1
MNKFETYMNGYKIILGCIVTDHLGTGIVEYNDFCGLRVNYMDGMCKAFTDYLDREELTVRVIGNTDYTPHYVGGRT